MDIDKYIVNIFVLISLIIGFQRDKYREMALHENVFDQSVESQGMECGICDLILGNLEQLRNHKQWIHQVKHND